MEAERPVDTDNAVAAAGAPENPLVALVTLGQSIWLDYITRDLVRGGELRRLIEQDGLRGMTSNPTIFQKAIAGGSDYDAQIEALLSEGKEAGAIFEALAVQDILNINITLLFARERHEQVMWAYVEALEQRAAHRPRRLGRLVLRQPGGHAGRPTAPSRDRCGER